MARDNEIQLEKGEGEGGGLGSMETKVSTPAAKDSLSGIFRE